MCLGLQCIGEAFGGEIVRAGELVHGKTDAIHHEGAGVFAGYFQWGDAAALRLEKKQFEDQIVDLKNQRETLSTRIAREQRDKEVCRKELAEVKKGAPAAAAPAPGGVVVE